MREFIPWKGKLLQGWVDAEEHLSSCLDRGRRYGRKLQLLLLHGEDPLSPPSQLGISVRQDYQRQGIARLMEIQEEWCRSQGIEKLCLEVDTLNTKAIGLYLSRGFVVEGTLRREAKMTDGTYRDLYVMGKMLEETTPLPVWTQATGFSFIS